MEAFLDFKLHGGTVKDHLILNAALLVGLAVVDRLVIAPFVGSRIAGDAKGARDRKAARWFFIHSFANVVVVASALGSVLSILDRPFDIMDTAVHTDASFFGSASRWPLTIVNSVHLYHMVGGFSLSAAAASFVRRSRAAALFLLISSACSRWSEAAAAASFSNSATRRVISA